MKKLNKSRFFALFVSAVLILNQADFLFIPVNSVFATTGSITVTLLKPNDGATVSGQVGVNAQVNTAETVDKVILHWSITQEGQEEMALIGSNNEYQYSWDTTGLPDGKYNLKARAGIGGLDYYSQTITVKVENSVSVTTDPVAGFQIKFVNAPDYISGSTIISAQTDTEVDGVIFDITGPLDMPDSKNYKYTAISGGGSLYYFNWDITDFPDGEYKTKAIATKDGQSKQAGKPIYIQRDQSKDPVASFNIKLVNAPNYISGSTIITARTDTEVDGVIFDITGPLYMPDSKNYKSTGIYEGNYNYSYKWDITNLPDGEYKVKAIATKDGQSVQAGTPIYIQRDQSSVSGDGTGSISAYLPECGVKKECSLDGTCTKKIITYDNKSRMINDGAVLLYHGVCRDDMGNADIYLPECGVKKVCSSYGTCSEVAKTYDNKSQMIEQGAEFLYHGVCEGDDGSGDFEKMCEEQYEPVCGEIKICEGDFCRVQAQTFSNMCKLRVNRGRLLYYGGCKDQAVDRDIMQIEEKSSLLVNDKLDNILAELQELRNIVREQENEIKYLRTLVVDLEQISQQMQSSINNFITYGVDDNTRRLGAGERAAVIHSFKSAFNKLPGNEEELSDAIKIANGRWPSLRSQNAEERAGEQFKNIYKRNPDIENPNDNAAVTVMAYGLRQKAENRNLESEKQGIKTFRHIYNKLPETTEEWNIMQAITYSGATR